MANWCVGKELSIFLSEVSKISIFPCTKAIYVDVSKMALLRLLILRSFEIVYGSGQREYFHQEVKLYYLSHKLGLHLVQQTNIILSFAQVKFTSCTTDKYYIIFRTS